MFDYDKLTCPNENADNKNLTYSKLLKYPTSMGTFFAFQHVAQFELQQSLIDLSIFEHLKKFQYRLTRKTAREAYIMMLIVFYFVFENPLTPIKYFPYCKTWVY